MKKNVLIVIILFFAATAWAQENMFTLSGGYAFANLESSDADATGFRINGLYEFNPNEGKVAHGFSVGYIGTTAEFTTTVGQAQATYKFTLNNWPVYYAPKYMFGSGSAKGFVKGALGVHFSGYKAEGPIVSPEASDNGFYGGAGLGFMKTFNEKAFINFEYEWAYLSNAYFQDGFLNSIMVGIGMKF